MTKVTSLSALIYKTTISCERGYIVYKCKNCVFCTWACPGWMCINKEHPDFDLDNDCPITVNLEDDGCKLFCLGDNDYKRFLKEKSENNKKEYDHG